MLQKQSLKEEYLARKQLKEQDKAQEAKEFLESYTFIFERLDTANISKIVTAMANIENVISPVLDKVPGLKQALDSAEAELNSLLSGRGGADPKKTTAMLGRALSLYNGLSEFFSRELDLLLKTKLFDMAKKTPDEPMSRIAGLNIQVIQDAFLQGLKIAKTGNWLKKVFSSDNLPYVDNKALSQQLTNLTFNELLKLGQAKRVPVAVSQAQVDSIVAQAAPPVTATGEKQSTSSAQPGEKEATPVNIVKNTIGQALTHMEGQDLKTIVAHLQSVLQKLTGAGTETVAPPLTR